MSIALTTPFTVSLNGTQVENDTTGACIGYSVDYIGNALIYFFAIGTLAGSPPNLVAGPQGQIQGKSIQVTVNLLTGAWSDNLGDSGTIPGSILNPIVAQLLANRNSAEGFMAVSGGLMPGVVTAWAAL